MNKSEALRLADLLESCPLAVGDAQQAVAAAELRRLHAQRDVLLEALTNALPQLVGPRREEARAVIKAMEETK